MKKKKKFRIALMTYTIVWVFAIVGICIKLWNVFDHYQVQYVLASESVNPDLLMEKVIDDYNPEHIMNLAMNSLPQLSEYETADHVESMVKSVVDGKNITFRKEERFSERKPIYEILANQQVIGLVSLKQGMESDEFGFRKYEVDEEVLHMDFFTVMDYAIKVPCEYQIQVNGKAVASDLLTFQEQNTSIVEKAAVERTGYSFVQQNITLQGFCMEPQVAIIKSGNTIALSADEENCFCYDFDEDFALVEDVRDYVLTAGEVYIQNTNQMASFADVAKYLVTGSNAYANVKSVQSGLSWAGKPDELTIVDKSVSNLRKYADDTFTVKTTYRINRLYREVTYDEEMSYEWLFVKSGDKWLIQDFALAVE